jgi:hypothetical protein
MTQALISLASPTLWGAPSFAFLAKGGYHERIRNGICAERTKVAPATSIPALAKKTQGQGTLDPNFRPPFDRISDSQIPLTRLRKWSNFRFSVSRTTI